MTSASNAVTGALNLIDALPPGVTLAQLAARDGITAVEIGHELDIEKSTLSRNLKRLLALGLIIMDPPAGRRVQVDQHAQAGLAADRR